MLNLKLPGQLIAVYDWSMAIDAVNHNCSVIYIGDTVGMAQFQNMFIPGAVFVPSVSAMQALVDGDQKSFTDMYLNQLYIDPVVHEFLDTIVCAMYQGKTVIFYVPKEACEFGYHEILFQFICNVYGLHIQKDRQFPYFQEFGFMTVIDALYNFKQIDKVSYLAYIPDAILDDANFMSQRLCPMFKMKYDQNSVNYLKNWKHCINSASKPLKSMVSFVDDSI